MRSINIDGDERHVRIVEGDGKVIYEGPFDTEEEKAKVDADVRIPAGLVVGEDPEADAARFRRTERGICLITQPMIDRLPA